MKTASVPILACDTSQPGTHTTPLFESHHRRWRRDPAIDDLRRLALILLHDPCHEGNKAIKD